MNNVRSKTEVWKSDAPWDRMQKPQFFSRSLEQFGGKIPFIVSDLINRLREMGAENVEGIFRISGSASNIADLCSELDSGRMTDWSKYANVHTIACALKKYFRDMVQTDPLVPGRVYNEFLAIPKSNDADEMVAKYKAVVMQLSIARRLTFAFLFRFLYEITQNEEKNKMNANNVAIVFSPNLLAPDGGSSPQNSYQYTPMQNKTIFTLIPLTERVFEDVEINQNSFVSDAEMATIAAPPIGKMDIERFTELREIRKKSVIPFVPYEFLCDHNFVRPNRVVTFQEE